MKTILKAISDEIKKMKNNSEREEESKPNTSFGWHISINKEKEEKGEK